MASGRNALPPMIIGKRYTFLHSNREWYTGILVTIIESGGGVRTSRYSPPRFYTHLAASLQDRALFRFGNGRESWATFSQDSCFETNGPLSPDAPPNDLPVLNALSHDPLPFQHPPLATYPFRVTHGPYGGAVRGIPQAAGQAYVQGMPGVGVAQPGIHMPPGYGGPHHGGIARGSGAHHPGALGRSAPLSDMDHQGPPDAGVPNFSMPTAYRVPVGYAAHAGSTAYPGNAASQGYATSAGHGTPQPEAGPSTARPAGYGPPQPEAGPSTAGSYYDAVAYYVDASDSDRDSTRSGKSKKSGGSKK